LQLSVFDALFVSAARIIPGHPGGIVERRLAAIVAADVAGYSRLMGKDEEGTLAQLKGQEGLRDRFVETNRQRPVEVSIRLDFDRHELVPLR
jgi:class 3 adenylate cyclase